MKKVNLGIVGASGMVGRTFLKVLEERSFPIDNLYLFSSKKSAGEKISFYDKQYTFQELTEDSFDIPLDLLLFSAGGEISKKYCPIAKKKGIICIDNSSAWRMDPKVPLVVPEVNPQDISWHEGIISNPNCSTIQGVVVLYPLHKKFKIKRIVYSSYQAVSGSGIMGISDLESGLKGDLNPKCYPHPIANNCIPHIDIFMPNGYTKEEMKMIEETKKIFNSYYIGITATAVRVPVFNCHSESINVEFDKNFKIEDVYSILENSPSIIVEDDLECSKYPLAINAKNKDMVYVGRIRRDESIENGLNLWVVADNIRKGAATNAVQIAELVFSGSL